MPLKYDGYLKRFDVTVPFYCQQSESGKSANKDLDSTGTLGLDDCPKLLRDVSSDVAHQVSDSSTREGAVQRDSGNSDVNYADWEALARKLIAWCTKFAFQLEKGKDGYLHWQIRCQLIHVKTVGQLLGDAGPRAAIGGNWLQTSNGIHPNGKQFHYVMKEDGRVDGPWTDADKIEALPVLTRQLIQFLTYVEKDRLYSWQKQIKLEMEKQDDRFVHHIMDDIGNSGKSIFCEWLVYQKLCMEVPMLKNMDELMGFIFSFPIKKAYLLDMPRGLNKDRLSELYGGIECLKNGYVYEKRYQGKSRRFDRPQVCTFGNAWPDMRLLSLDRWKLWQLCVEQDVENDAGRPLGDKYLKEVSVQTIFDNQIRDNMTKKEIKSKK
jgi:hypothetical protein